MRVANLEVQGGGNGLRDLGKAARSTVDANGMLAACSGMALPPQVCEGPETSLPHLPQILRALDTFGRDVAFHVELERAAEIHLRPSDSLFPRRILAVREFA